MSVGQGMELVSVESPEPVRGPHIQVARFPGCRVVPVCLCGQSFLNSSPQLRSLSSPPTVKDPSGSIFSVGKGGRPFTPGRSCHHFFSVGEEELVPKREDPKGLDQLEMASLGGSPEAWKGRGRALPKGWFHHDPH